VTELYVGRSADLAEGARKIVAHEKLEIGVIRAKGQLYAYRNVCPHQGGPVCEGLLIHRVEEIIGEDRTFKGMRFSEDDLHIVCPWHGWEFDVKTGRCAADGKHGLKTFEVVEKSGEVYVRIG